MRGEAGEAGSEGSECESAPRPLTRVHQSQILKMLTKYLYASSTLGGDAHGHIATVLSIDSHILNISLSLLSSHCYIPPLGYLLPYL